MSIGSTENKMEETSRKHEKDWFKENVADQCRWAKDVRRVAEVVGCIWPPPVTKD